MLPFSQLAQDVNIFAQTVKLIEKIDNKLGKSIAFDRANYKLQQIKNRMHQSINSISKNIENRKPPNPRLTPLTALPRARNHQPDSFLTEYLSRTQKRDERYNKYQSAHNIDREPEFRKTKPMKSKTKNSYKFHGSSNLKHQHNRTQSKQLNQEEYKQGMYTLSNKYPQDDIDMNYIEEVMPKPMKNPIVRRKLDSIFVTKNQNNTTIYDELLPKEYPKDQSNIFLTNHNEPFLNLNFTEIHKKERIETGTENVKSRLADGPYLDILNCRVVGNETLKAFKLQNLYRWSSISPVITAIENLLRRCSITSARIKSKQLINLSVFCKKVPDRLLLRCLNNPQEVEHHLIRQMKQKVRTQESSASFIQNYWRYQRRLRA